LVYVLHHSYGLERDHISHMLSALQSTMGVCIESHFVLDEILSLWPDTITDYGDAILAAYARKWKIPVLTFDKKFQKQLKKAGISFIVTAPPAGM
jgi:predicted nucleic-acid-binding protein